MFDEEQQKAQAERDQPGTPDQEMGGFVPVPDPFMLQSDQLLDEAEAFFKEDSIEEGTTTQKRKRAAVTNIVKWTNQEERDLKTNFKKYIEKGDKPSPQKIRKLMPQSIQNRSFSSVKNKIYRMINKNETKIGMIVHAFDIHIYWLSMKTKLPSVVTRILSNTQVTIRALESWLVNYLIQSDTTMQITSYESRVRNPDSQVVYRKLRTQVKSRESWVTNCELRVASYEQRITSRELRTTRSYRKLRVAHFPLLSHKEFVWSWFDTCCNSPLFVTSGL